MVWKHRLITTTNFVLLGIVMSVVFNIFVAASSLSSVIISKGDVSSVSVKKAYAMADVSSVRNVCDISAKISDIVI